MHARSYTKLSKILPISIATALAACGYAEAANYRFYRFSPTRLASGTTAIQLSEFEFDKAGTRVPYPAGTTVVSSNPSKDGGSVNATTGIKSEAPIWLTDNNTSSKWYNSVDASPGISSIVFDVGSGNSLDVDGYRLATGNDSPERRPISWRLEGSDDGATWTTLDIQANYPTPVATRTYTPVIPIPLHPPVVFTAFSYTPQILTNGESFTVNYLAEQATSVSLTPGNPKLLASGDSATLKPPSSADTTYKLIGSSSAGGASAEQDFVIRSVANATQTYRYVRFTPLATGNGAIQFGGLDFTFFDSAGNFDHIVTPVQVIYDGDTSVDTTDYYRPNYLGDGDPNTAWYSPVLRPVVFDFGSPEAFNHYQFNLSNFDYSPVKWRMEGSNDSASWNVIENVNTFAYPMPAGNGGFVADIPLPTNASMPLELSDFSAVRASKVAGNPVNLHWAVAGAKTLTLTVGSNAPVTLSPTATSLVVNPPAEKTTYTLTATSIQNAAAPPVSLALSLYAPEATVPALPNYPDIALAGDAIVANGASQWINNSASSNSLTVLGDRTRLSLIPDSAGVKGSAFFKTPVSLSNGFDTTFDVFLATKDRGYGAYGLSFVVQNTPDGAATLPASNAQTGPATNAVAVGLSTWDWNGSPQGQAKVKIYKNQSLVTTVAAEKSGVVMHSADFTSNQGASFLGSYASKSYKVHINYTANKILNLFIDDIPIVTNYTLDLSGAVDSSGKAFVGFTAGADSYLSEDVSLSSWVFATDSAVTPTDLKITSSSFDFSGGVLTLAWNSTTGTKYRITHSTTLGATDWTPIGTTTTATGASTTANVPFTQGAKDFFRVEVAP